MGRVLTRCKLQLEAEIGVFPEREADIDSAICGRTEELTTMNCLCILVRLYLVKKDLFLTFRGLMSAIVDVPHRQPPKFHFIYLFNKYVLNILNMVYNLRFFLFKMQFVS